MPAYKKGTDGYKKQQERRYKTLIAKYGSEEAYLEYYSRLGKLGGTKSRGGGFACKKKGKDGLTGPERARLCGAVGGLSSRKPHKMARDKNGRAVRKDGKVWGSKKEN